MIYLIDNVFATDKVSGKRLIIPCNLSSNQKIVDTNYFDGISRRYCKIIITEINDSERKFGGAFTKIAVKGDPDKGEFISATFGEQSLKDIIREEFNIVRESLYRYY